MQSKTTLKRFVGTMLKSLMFLGFVCLLSSSLMAQVYVNGNLSTGATASNGTAAPAGYTWSEVQAGNVNAGFGAQIANSNSLADDFTIAAGTWTISKFTFFGYSTGYTGATSPFNELRFQIFNTDPSTGTPVPVFGDLTTNRLSSSSTALMYRIFNATTGTTREIWKMEANVNIVLPAGTYWVEWQTGVNTGLTSNFTPSSTVVGSVTQPGNNALQHNSTSNTWTPVVDGTNPQDFNFVINYATSACTGTPDPGTTTSSVASACPGAPISLGVSNNVNGIGITYQWQSSPDNVTYTDITGATGNSYTTSMTTSTWYRLAVTCAGSGLIGYSVPVQVSQAPTSSCICASGATSTADEDIFGVKIGTLDNTSTCTTLAPGFGSVQNKYSNYTSGTGAPAPGVIIAGGTNPISITVGTCGGNYTNSVAVWIDYDRDGQFSAAEKVYVSANGTQGPHVETGNAFIPPTALLGTTVMRVVCVETGTPGNINPCGTYTWGETEDYLVTIRQCVPVALTAQPVSATANCGGTVSFSVAASGDNPAYTWEQRTSPTAPWTFVTNGGMFSGANTGILTITGATSAMNGYQYRAIFTGSCTATDFSNIATLTVNPITAQVTPTSATICNGSTQSIQILNAASASNTTTVASGAINLLINDATATGVISAPITISGIPANAVIQDVSVKFNINHTWVGDIDINLIAPNGQNMNLVGSLNNGTGSNGTDNFTNTIISNTSTTPISGATAPRTGTFAAEKRAGYGPVGNEQTVADWPALLTQLNGDWKLAIADFWNGDEGTLTDWSISITYTSPTLATGTFSPTTALYTDASLTTPYTGGQINTVYAAPSTSTTYTVVVQTPACTSSPLQVPVDVVRPIGTVTQPVNQAICENGQVDFTSSATGGPITYQWQVSTDGGTSYSNVTDGGVYSGAATATLSISGATISMNGNKYRVQMSVPACGSAATSNAVTLTVNANPTATVSAAPFTSIFPGLTTTVSSSNSASGNTYQWYLNGGLVPNQNTSSIPVNVDGLGNYTVTITDQFGCVGSASNSVDIIDSLNTTLFIYPNPNNGVFQVRYFDKNQGPNNPKILSIYDSKGSRIYRKSFSTGSVPFGRMDVDLTRYGKGVYFIDLNDAGGNRLASERVVVQ